MKRTVTLNGGGGCQTREGTINNGDAIVPIVPIILKKRLDVGVDVLQFQRKEKVSPAESGAAFQSLE